MSCESPTMVLGYCRLELKARRVCLWKWMRNWEINVWPDVVECVAEAIIIYSQRPQSKNLKLCNLAKDYDANDDDHRVTTAVMKKIVRVDDMSLPTTEASRSSNYFSPPALVWKLHPIKVSAIYSMFLWHAQPITALLILLSVSPRTSAWIVGSGRTAGRLLCPARPFGNVSITNCLLVYGRDFGINRIHGRVAR